MLAVAGFSIIQHAEVNKNKKKNAQKMMECVLKQVMAPTKYPTDNEI